MDGSPRRLVLEINRLAVACIVAITGLLQTTHNASLSQMLDSYVLLWAMLYIWSTMETQRYKYREKTLDFQNNSLHRLKTNTRIQNPSLICKTTNKTTIGREEDWLNRFNVVLNLSNELLMTVWKSCLNPLTGKGNTLLILRKHQNIQRVFFLKFSHIFVTKWKEEKHNKKFLVWISKTGGGK